MGRLRRDSLPSYRRHRPSGQAVVTLDSRDIYLGPYRSPESRAKYDRVVAEWLAGPCSIDQREGHGNGR